MKTSGEKIVSKEERIRQQNDVNDWLKKNIVKGSKAAIFLTLKFHRKSSKDKKWGKYSVNEKQAQKAVRNLLNKVDRAVFNKRQIEQGFRLERVIFRHTGADSDNIHYHGIVIVDEDKATILCALFNQIWKSNTDRWIDSKRSCIQLVKSIPDVAHYCAHEVFTLTAEHSWDLALTHIGEGKRMRFSKHKRLAAEASQERMSKTQELKALRLAKQKQQNTISWIQTTIKNIVKDINQSKPRGQKIKVGF